jgi:hypothetical protein
VSLLLCGSPETAQIEMKKGSAVLMRFSDKVGPGKAELLWLLPPRAVLGLD